MRTPNQVSQDIISKLKVTIPQLSMEVGTPERKIVDAVGEAISESYMDQYITGTNFDIDSKSGLELEQFVGIFGFGRLQGRRALGVVRVEVATEATQDIHIQNGAQFYVSGAGEVPGTHLYFHATQRAVLPRGHYSVDVPVECTIIGSIGNVPPGSMASVGSALGIATVTNLSPMTGGVDVENDNELRERFKATLLRNIAGTSDFYLGLAYANQNVSKAAVYGPVSLYRTQIEAPQSGMDLDVNQDVKYVWEEHTSVFRNLATRDERFYTPGVDYLWTGGPRASIHRPTGSLIEPGEIIDVEFEYTTKASRNDPQQGITNKVDLFVNGADPVTVTERTVVGSNTFNQIQDHELNLNNFRRLRTAGERPSTQNRFMRLGSVPLVAFPHKLVIKTDESSVANTYEEGVHYWVVVSDTLMRGSEREISGIEWTSAGPQDHTPITLTYSYNRTPQLLSALIKGSKQITTDVVVHEADYRYIQVYLDVEYDRGVNITDVAQNVQEALRQFFSTRRFGDWIEVSDVLLAVRQVRGIDNAKLTPDTASSTNYGLKTFMHPESDVHLDITSEDFKLDDDQLPIFMEAFITRKANR